MDKIYDVSKLIKKFEDLNDKSDMEFLQLITKYLANNVQK